jgi:hypothetical protein
MFISDPGYEFLIPDPGVKKIPAPGGSASKNLSIFKSKNCFYALGSMIQMFIPDPGSRS